MAVERKKIKCSCGYDAQYKKVNSISIIFCSNLNCPNYSENWNYRLEVA